MLRVSIALLVFLFTAGLTLDSKWLWHDQRDRELFVAELRANNVPYRMDQDGSIWYPSAEAARVDEIFRRVVERDRQLSSFSFEDPDDARLFRERMSRRGIPFGEVTKLGRSWIQWDKKYDSQANAIQEAVEDEASLRRRKARSAN